MFLCLYGDDHMEAVKTFSAAALNLSMVVTVKRELRDEVLNNSFLLCITKF